MTDGKRTRKRHTPQQKANIVLEILREERTLAQIAAEYGIHPNQLRKWKAQAVERLPAVFDSDSAAAKERLAEKEAELESLYTQIGRLTTQVNWLKKKVALTRTRDERRRLLDRNDPELTITTQAELLSLNRTGLYYLPVPPGEEKLHIKRRIDEIYTEYPFMGSRRITLELRKEMRINRKAVQRHMREMGIYGRLPGPHLSRPAPENKIFPYLLRNLAIVRPNQVWGIDITCIRLVHGWLYLVAVLDWFSRLVMSWALDQTLEMGFVMESVEMALTQGKPEIWNSDQGGHFTSEV